VTSDARPRFALLVVLTVLGTLLWIGVPRLGNVPWVWDNVWFEQYANLLGTKHRLPTKTESLEYSLPPGLPATAALLKGGAKALGPVDARVLPGLPRALRVAAWVLLVLGSGRLLLTAAPGSRRRRVGMVLAAGATVLAALDVLAAATTVKWVPWLLPEIGSVLGLALVTALLAREVWPDWRWAPPVAAFAVALFPVVFRMGTVLHPDPLFALFGCLALLLTLRAHRLGWSVRRGGAAGALLAAAALTRQSAVLLIVAIGLIALLLGRRDTRRFLVAAAAAVVLLAGPWWGYQASRFGNPIQSNLNRPGIMLDHEPLAFYSDVPLEIVTRPWSLLGRNLLFPKFHVGLWSDWSGIGDFGGPHGTEAEVLASSQSVLGFGGDAFVLGGLACIGLPALLRAVRLRPRAGRDAALAALTLLFCVAWAAYLAMLIRFPQRDADPNSPHYLLFLAPVSAIFGLAAARALWASSGWRRGAVVAWTSAYVVSWSLVLSLML
jgi:Dolichyl-phosphate-mannose-protein mannosyltransferase